VLIAEDEVLVRQVCHAVLAAEGYAILIAASGRGALEISRAFPGEIHLLLSDIRMPGMDGWQVRDILVTERPGIRVLLMSGNAEEPTDPRSFLRKPFLIDDLRDRVRHLLEGSAAAGAGKTDSQIPPWSHANS